MGYVSWWSTYWYALDDLESEHDDEHDVHSMLHELCLLFAILNVLSLIPPSRNCSLYFILCVYNEADRRAQRQRQRRPRQPMGHPPRGELNTRSLLS